MSSSLAPVCFWGVRTRLVIQASNYPKISLSSDHWFSWFWHNQLCPTMIHAQIHPGDVHEFLHHMPQWSGIVVWRGTRIRLWFLFCISLLIGNQVRRPFTTTIFSPWLSLYASRPCGGPPKAHKSTDWTAIFVAAHCVQRCRTPPRGQEEQGKQTFYCLLLAWCHYVLSRGLFLCYDMDDRLIGTIHVYYVGSCGHWDVCWQLFLSILRYMLNLKQAYSSSCLQGWVLAFLVVVSQLQISVKQVPGKMTLKL